MDLLDLNQVSVSQHLGQEAQEQQRIQEKALFMLTGITCVVPSLLGGDRQTNKAERARALQLDKSRLESFLSDLR